MPPASLPEGGKTIVHTFVFFLFFFVVFLRWLSVGLALAFGWRWFVLALAALVNPVICPLLFLFIFPLCEVDFLGLPNSKGGFT